MSNVFSKIKFSRCREVMSSRAAALLHLGDREFTRGEPVIVNYYEDTSANSSINTIMAVGVKTGRGKDCFRIITLGQYEIIWGVVDVLPDVSALVHDELYLYKDSNDLWYYVSAPDGVTRIIEPLLPVPHMFLNIEDNIIYVSDTDRQIRPIYDMYSKQEIDDLLEVISGGDFSSLSALERKIDEAYRTIQEVKEQNDELVQMLEDLGDSVDVVQDFADRVDEIERKVSVLDVNQDGTVSATLSSVSLVDNASDSSPVIINKSTAITTNNITEIIDVDIEPISTSTLNEIFV